MSDTSLDAEEYPYDNESDSDQERDTDDEDGGYVSEFNYVHR